MKCYYAMFIAYASLPFDEDEFDCYIKKEIMYFGLFELIQSIGFDICVECLNNFSNSRYTRLYDFMRKQLIKSHSERLVLQNVDVETRMNWVNVVFINELDYISR